MLSFKPPDMADDRDIWRPVYRDAIDIYLPVNQKMNISWKHDIHAIFFASCCFVRVKAHVMVSWNDAELDVWIAFAEVREICLQPVSLLMQKI